MGLWIKNEDGTVERTAGGGSDGQPGADGNMWHVGSGAPGSTLGEIGDYYLDGDDGWVYVKRTASSWTNLYVNLTGPAGDGSGGGDGDGGHIRADGRDEYTPMLILEAQQAAGWPNNEGGPEGWLGARLLLMGHPNQEIHGEDSWSSAAIYTEQDIRQAWGDVESRVYTKLTAEKDIQVDGDLRTDSIVGADRVGKELSIKGGKGLRLDAGGLDPSGEDLPFTLAGSPQVTGDLHVDGDATVGGTINGQSVFGIADGIDTQDVLDRAETATMPALDDEGVATTDVESIMVNEVVTALLAKVRELSERIVALEAS